MKRLSKTQFDTTKIINNDELSMLRGGTQPGDCICICQTWEGEILGVIGGPIELVNALTCNPMCIERYEHVIGYWSC